MKHLKPAAVFSDNCVLQRGKNIAVFGTGEEGTRVEAYITGTVLNSSTRQESRGSAYIKNGRFEIALPPLREGLNHTLKITAGDEQIIYKNIAIGEVWLAGGQSNMEFELQNCTEHEVLNNPPDEMIRFYYTQKKAYMDEEFFASEAETAWECFGAAGTKFWSAVGYFFGAKLKEILNVPVGIIGCNWGGTSASAWMPIGAIAEQKDLQVYLDAYEEATKGKTEEEQRREYAEYVVYQAEFDKKTEACYKENPDMEWADVLKIVGECRWPGPMGCSNPFRPAGLYDCMLKRVMPYSLKGFIYYQGESDDHLPHLYERLFTRMIRQWREDWQEDELPFIFAQLPMHRYKQDADFKNWCLIREAQERVYRTVKNTGMACILDQGVFNDIHPKAKKTVGERMCAQALKVAYGKEAAALPADGPLLHFTERSEHVLKLHFYHAKDGFVLTEGKEKIRWENGRRINGIGFEIAGEDGNYVPARAAAVENSSDGGWCITVESEAVESPAFARYQWTNYGEVSLFGANGIPVAPFRTSRKDGFHPSNQTAEIQQNMECANK
jgi:sialate O-acetylesterase